MVETRARPACAGAARPLTFLEAAAMTVTPAKLAANRANAKKSTGPRTARGKRRSRMNAIKHGMFCDQTLLPDEDRHRLARFRAAIVRELEPRNNNEQAVCDQIVAARWRLHRLSRFEHSRDFTTAARLAGFAQRLELSIERLSRRLGNLRGQSQKPNEYARAELPLRQAHACNAESQSVEFHTRFEHNEAIAPAARTSA
jgi:hypothetical protein